MVSRTITECLLCLGFVLLQHASAFQASFPPTSLFQRRVEQHDSRLFQSSPDNRGFGTNKSSELASKGRTATSSSPAGDFAFQEMVVYFNAMQRQGATSRTMDPTKRSELEGLIRKLLANRTGLRLQDIGPAILPKSEWKLMFSTSQAVLESLPIDATVFLNILDDQNLDYVLKFSKKTLGLESITAKCKYTFDAGPMQPGLLTFVYENITTNLLGMQNLGVGFFGLLKGRANYVESAYFDRTFWIEKGVSKTGQGDFINVYMRMDN